MSWTHGLKPEGMPEDVTIVVDIPSFQLRSANTRRRENQRSHAHLSVTVGRVGTADLSVSIWLTFRFR